MKVFTITFISAIFILIVGSLSFFVPIEQEQLEEDNSIPAQSMEPETGADTQCPADMVMIEHNYCPNLEQNCKKWLDKESCGMWGKDKSGKKYCKAIIPPMRCAEFYPSVCKSSAKDIIHVKVCVNKYEGNNNPNQKPEAYVSFTEAQNRCAEQGKRLCKDKEWVSACEGEDNFPYSTGLIRPSNQQCNIDTNKSWKDPSKHSREELSEVFASSTEFPECKTKSGVYQMSGNYDEWVESTNPNTPYKSVLFSGHPLHVRNRCRKSTVSHNGVDAGKLGSGFKYYDISYRCCKDLDG